MIDLPQAILNLLACPACLHKVTVGSSGARCQGCGCVYPLIPSGQLDLRLRSPRTYRVDFRIGEPVSSIDHPHIGPIPPNPQAKIDYRAIPIPRAMRHGNRLTRELLSYFPRSDTGGAMLDLGCGAEPAREICAQTNLDYVGIDYEGSPHLLGDAHSLPFVDSAFDLVVSFAVLEHLRWPFVAMQEVTRVLKPGGLFIGSVAFLEPYHLESFYHPSHLGTLNLLTSAGLKVLYLEPNSRWSGLRALMQMGLFPDMPGALCDLMVLPIQLLHRLWWKIGYLLKPRATTSEQARRLANAGGFRFVCVRPADQPSSRS